jgi:hypothetical protein
MHTSGPVLAIHLLTAIGVLLLTAGSFLQARVELRTYRAELKESGLEEVFRKLLDVSRETMGAMASGIPANPFRVIPQTIDLVRLELAVSKNISRMLKEGGEKATRIRELLNKSVAWVIIWYGGTVAVVAAVIQLVLDFRT